MLLHASYGAEDLRVQLGLRLLDSRHLFTLEDVKAQIRMSDADINVKIEKRSESFIM